MGFARRSAVGLLKSAALVALLGALGSSCSSTPSATVLPTISYTDENSRALAAHSLSLLKERSTDYRVGPEDILEISIFEWEQRGETRTLDVRVTETGVIALPVVGDLKVEELTAEQIKQLLERHLLEGGILKIPRVSVLIKEFRSKRVAVVGAVQEPGVYTLRQNVGTLLELLTLAGGITDRAGQVLYVIHGGAQPPPAQEAVPSQRDVIAVDLYELLEEGSQELNVVVQNGDMINVPVAKEFSVLGYVKRPGRFPLTRRTTVMEGIAMAEGLLDREATPADCMLKRQTAEGTVFIPLDLEAISQGTRPNLQLLPNDVVEVRQSPTRHVVLEFLDLFKGLFTFGYTLNRP
jgi:polysaccharide export outer membrane protein